MLWSLIDLDVGEMMDEGFEPKELFLFANLTSLFSVSVSVSALVTETFV